MMKSNPTKNSKKPTVPLKDVSRFNRWVHQMDAKDQSLNPGARKGKWIVTLSILFVLFVLSFILFPSVKVGHKNLDGTRQKKTPVNPEANKTSPLEMPVDSFEQQLKQKIHEDNPEKE
jgi:hypothetical protein